jgi:hypothetical protein
MPSQVKQLEVYVRHNFPKNLPAWGLRRKFESETASSDWYGKYKGKVCPRTSHEGSEGESRYSSTLSSTSTLGMSRWLTPRSGRFTPGKGTRHPLYRRLVGAQGGSGPVRKISPPTWLDPRTVELVASRYTDWAIPIQMDKTHENERRRTSFLVLSLHLFTVALANQLQKSRVSLAMPVHTTASLPQNEMAKFRVRNFYWKLSARSDLC